MLARLQRLLSARTLIGTGVLALCVTTSPADAAPSKGAHGPSKGTSSKGSHGKGGQHSKLLVQRFTSFGTLIAANAAAKKKAGKKGKAHDRYLVRINPGPGGLPEGPTLYLCKKKGKKPPTECVDPGPRPPEPPGGFTPPCVHCDPKDKEAKYDDFMTKKLAADALHKLLELMKEGQFWGAVGDMFSNMYDALSALTGPGSMAFKAAKWGAGQMLSAASDAAKEAAMESFLQGLIDTLGLDLEPDDLTTEGGLNAAIALADAVAQDAFDDYRAAWELWASCRSDAVGQGRKPVDTQDEADECNEAAQDAADAAAAAAWAEIWNWETASLAYEACVEYNQNLEFDYAVWQSTPC